MNKVNYSDKCEEILNARGTGEKSVVLQCCCAPCSSWCLTYLQGRIGIKALYYNPNIVDPIEYDKRKDELGRLIGILNCEYPGADIEYIPENLNSSEYLETVKGLEKEPEGGIRCEKCFELRLRKAAMVAKAEGADFFGTTLTISPLKNAELINKIGEKIADEVGVAFLFSDFKKKEGYKKSVELSEKYGLYRQNFCGCPFSKNKSNGETK